MRRFQPHRPAPMPMSPQLEPDSSPVTTGDKSRTSETVIVVLLAVVVVAHLVGLGWGPFNEPDEARYAAIPRHMVEGGAWFSPEINGFPFL